MSAYEDYKKNIETYISDNRHVIEETKRLSAGVVFPQHILFAKTASREFETDQAKTLTIDDKFYFTEKLVNMLMLYAYLKGQRGIDIESYARGWEDATADTIKYLEDHDV